MVIDPAGIPANVPDLSARAEALNPACSFIVQAPAGSGKTELLMQRYLLLLSGVKRPEEVLAMTFTRKAAGEMHRRISDALRSAAFGESPEMGHEALTFRLAGEVLRQDKARGWGLLENAGRLKILTIDAFCASLVRQTPLSSMLGAFPVVRENADGLYLEAAGRTVEMIEGKAPEAALVAEALRHMDNSAAALSARLVEMLGKRDQWLRHTTKAKDESELRQMIEGSFARLVEHELDIVKRLFPEGSLESLVRLADYAGANLKASGEVSQVVLLAGIKEAPSEAPGDLKKWKAIREMLLTDKNEWRRRVNKTNGFPSPDAGYKALFFELLDELKESKGLLERLALIEGLPEPCLEQEDWDALKTLLKLLPIADKHLREVFKERGEADFQAISMAALASLGAEDSPTDVMLSIDLKLKHILVDEYQDTSRTQLLLLSALTRGWEDGDGRTLFVVGDPMQSIYGFRDSDVGLFLDARINGIGSVQLKPITLSSNFRSGAALVDWCNNAFEGAFPDEEDVFTGSIRFSRGQATRTDITDSGVQVRLFNGRSDGMEAEGILSIVKGIRRDQTIAVLCRDRNHLGMVIEGFKNNRVAFKTVDMDPLASRAVVYDLLTVLRAMLHPYDRVAWLAMLRAPWCGASLKDVLCLCKADKDSPVWRLINDPERLNLISQDGRRRIVRLAGEIGRANGLRGRVSLAVLVEGLWTGLGGPACLKEEIGLKHAEVFFEALQEIEASREPDIMGAIIKRLDALYANDGNDSNIDLMTIHKAKGLEFDHVIVPGLGRPPRRRDKKMLLWMERGEDLFFAPIEKMRGRRQSPHYEHLRLIEGQKAAIEAARVLYVACTRARRGLYLFGHVKEDKEGRIAAPAGSLLSYIFNSLGGAAAPEHAESEAKETQGQATSAQGAALTPKRLPIEWTMPASTPAFKPKDLAEIEDNAGPEFWWAGHAIRRLGTVVHGYLCRISSEGLLPWNDGRILKEGERIKSMLAGFGLNAKDAAGSASEAIKMLISATNDAKGRWVLSAHAKASSEMALTGIADGAVVHAVIDRTFVDENNIRWIIDFKTGVHRGAGIEEFIEMEKERYRAQLERYEKLLKSKGETCEIKKALYYPAMLRWVEVDD